MFIDSGHIVCDLFYDAFGINQMASGDILIPNVKSISVRCRWFGAQTEVYFIFRSRTADIEFRARTSRRLSVRVQHAIIDGWEILRKMQAAPAINCDRVWWKQNIEYDPSIDAQKAENVVTIEPEIG